MRVISCLLWIFRKFHIGTNIILNGYCIIANFSPPSKSKYRHTVRARMKSSPISMTNLTVYYRTSKRKRFGLGHVLSGRLVFVVYIYLCILYINTLVIFNWGSVLILNQIGFVVFQLSVTCIVCAFRYSMVLKYLCS